TNPQLSLFTYTTLFRSAARSDESRCMGGPCALLRGNLVAVRLDDAGRLGAFQVVDEGLGGGIVPALREDNSVLPDGVVHRPRHQDRKSTRLNSSHVKIS